ncbi:MAG TPA: hypothetical protein VFS46_05200 [Nitrososphaera sp.]|nr:hypothetical protein [Nitrososphaera sp.]
MKKIALPLAASLLIVSFFVFSPGPALAHEEMCQNGICIVGGWVNEPPLVNQLNGIELEITRESDGQPITNAIAQLDVSVKKGTPTRSLDLEPQEEPGIYAATILPTQTGQYAVVIRGTVAGQAIDGQIEIQDVEDTARFNFPPASNGGSEIPQEVIEQLQTVITDLAAQVDEANVAAEEAKTAAASATESSAELKTAADQAYLFGMIGVGVGVAGIAIGVAALSRKEKA